MGAGPAECCGPALSTLPLFYCEQLPETSFTEVTRSCCALVSPIADPPPAALAFCTVPLTSTFFPTREAKSLLLPVSLYVVPDEEPLVAVGLGFSFSVGLAAADEPPDADASARMKPPAAALAVGFAGAFGDVLLGDDVSAFKQPVTVIVALLLRSCELVGAWLVGGWLVGDWLVGGWLD